MKLSKLLTLLLATVLIAALLAGCETADEVTGTPLVGTPGDEIAENACYLYTPQIVEDTFRYLDEIYIEKYPLLGLRWEHGTAADQRIFTALAQQITAGCTTDKEKVTAIYDWIVNNITYKKECSPFSTDTLYDGVGNCLSQSLLMQDLCRVLGIPAVYGDGFRGYMKTFTVEAMHTAEEGHAWCYVYVDSEWVLYDPVWRTAGTTDREFIAENFYVDCIGGITPIYDENNMPPFRTPGSVLAYINGKFITMNNGKPDPTVGGSWVNFALNVCVTSHLDNDGFFYLDGPAAYVYVGGPEEAEIYSNGWHAYGDSYNLFGDPLYFAYENGIQASEIVVSRNGADIYLDGGAGYKLLVPEDSYRVMYGELQIQAGYNGKVWELHDEAIPSGDYEYQWSSSDPDVATVDENGVVTSHQSGFTYISCVVTGVGNINGEEFTVDVSNNPGTIVYEEIDGEIVETKIPGYCMCVYFSDDISRPAKYEALDPGGSAAVELEYEGIGIYDLYPIMTDDLFTMADPVDGAITLPNAQNANGIFFFPSTYEMAIQQPNDLLLPIGDKTITLNRDDLRTFTLVTTEEHGELWYLALNEAGVGVFEEVPQEELPEVQVDFGYPMIPTEVIGMDFMDENTLAALPVENGVITLPGMTASPLPGVLPDTNGLLISSGAIQMALDQGCSLEIPLATGTMLLDEGALTAMLASEEAEMVELWLIPMENEWCDFGQQIPLSRYATDSVYSVYACATVPNGDINNLQGGTATVTVPLNETGGTYGVYFVDAYGNFTEVTSTVNGDGTITFIAPYFATYAIIDTAQTPVT